MKCTNMRQMRTVTTITATSIAQNFFVSTTTVVFLSTIDNIFFKKSPMSVGGYRINSFGVTIEDGASYRGARLQDVAVPGTVMTPRYRPDASCSNYAGTRWDTSRRGKVGCKYCGQKHARGAISSVSAPRKIQLALRDVDEVVSKQIITPVKEPTNWVHHIVIVAKPDDDIRICISEIRS
ncbi:unnamed protein product [Acanthoscelides obtectus]|uniref:Uncharacterized protein n=1 Tax=Acanthoscelides obtectus TaxID=200917 RepID=A0A9P0Q872_ACAOB|nr:unnamed protein product [Acanthoscelides obtectus]CAK1620067.1 hypothetical protein AOBTE_LOCUS171 [Acanthoscelides obtectus]